MKITRKNLHKIIKEEITNVFNEQQAVMTPAGGGGGANDIERKKIVKAALGHIRDKENPSLSVEDVALHIQYDDFSDFTMDATQTFPTNEPMRSDKEHEFDGARRWNAEMLKNIVLDYLPKKSVIRMAIFGIEADTLQQYVEQIAGNA